MGCVIVRGTIRNIGRKQQINDFSGLRFGNITPTDIDGIIEYKNKAFVIIEVKYGDAELPYGQRLCVERMVSDLSKPALAIIAEHSVCDENESIDVSKCNVREIYLCNEKKWRPPKRSFSVRELCEKFLGRYSI